MSTDLAPKNRTPSFDRQAGNLITKLALEEFFDYTEENPTAGKVELIKDPSTIVYNLNIITLKRRIACYLHAKKSLIL